MFRHLANGDATDFGTGYDVALIIETVQQRSTVQNRETVSDLNTCRASGLDHTSVILDGNHRSQPQAVIHGVSHALTQLLAHFPGHVDQFRHVDFLTVAHDLRLVRIDLDFIGQNFQVQACSGDGVIGSRSRLNL